MSNRMYVVVVLGLMVTACTFKKNESSESGRSEVREEKVTDVLTGYIKLKDALVSSDYEEAKSAALIFKDVVTGNVDPGYEKALLSVSEKLIAAGDIEAQREEFEQVSMLIYALAGNGQFGGRTLYKQFCPMAFDNKGAFWLSVDENILNPYFGEKMLRCGYTEEIL